MKYFLLINPFTYKPIHFTTFVDDNFVITKRTEVNGNNIIEKNKAICLEVDYDPSLLDKTYNPQTGLLI